jgi:hypothetical protein
VRIPTDRNKLLSEFLRKSSSSTIEMSGAGGMELYFPSYCDLF